MVSFVPCATPAGMLRFSRLILRRAIDTGAADGPLCREGAGYVDVLIERVAAGELDAAKAAEEACRLARALSITQPRGACA